MFKRFLLGLSLIVVGMLSAQDSGVEGIVVEHYYTSDSKDAKAGGPSEGAVTYRIYVNLKEGYSLQAVYGQKGHPLIISSSTTFFNHDKCGATGADLKRGSMEHNTELLDSYITIGAASMDRLGVPLNLDSDGSALNVKKKNGLANTSGGQSLGKQDGLMEGKLPAITNFGSDFSIFERGTEGGVFKTENGAWAVFGGFMGSTDENMVLIAQLTTDGELSFQFNLQIGHPDGSVVRYVAKEPKGDEQLIKALSYP